ncbi:MAG: putative Ig domain-containing protein [Planctomycetota bacterium]
MILPTVAAFGITTPFIPDAEQGQPYLFQLNGNCPNPPCTWGLDPMGDPLPAGFFLNPLTGEIIGSSNVLSNSNIIVTYTDALLNVDKRGYPFNVVKNLLVNAQTFRLDTILIEEDLTDLNGNDIHDPGSAETFIDLNANGKWDGKKGVFQEFWDDTNPKARWGLTKFTKFGADLAACIPASPAASFFTALQNAQPTPVSPLSDGLYGDINYYGFDAAFFADYDANSYKGCLNSDPIDSVKCRNNFVLIISSGTDVTSTNFSKSDCNVDNGNNTASLVQNACYGANTDMRSDKDGAQKVFTYIVNTFGSTNNDILEDAAQAGDGKYYEASASNLSEKLRQALRDILARAASGTAASVLASGEGSGANLIQAVFYPKRKFGNDEIAWIGNLSNFWYFVDPFFGSSSIYEDNASSTILDRRDDNVISLYFDTTIERTMAARSYDTGGDGEPDTVITPDIVFENLTSLWEAGKVLWSRNLGASPRTIKTTINGTSFIDFSTANKASLRPYMDLLANIVDNDLTFDAIVDDNDAGRLIDYLHGTDFNGLRERSVSIGGVGPKVWKLGDVLNSTPKISSWIPLNTYHEIYGDTTYESFLATSGAGTPDYENRGMVFSGANDGMLHAFNLGKLELSWGGQTEHEKARLTGGDLGKEIWAFIPKNALPYLKYITDETYCHIFTVDATPYIFDASINKPAACVAADYEDCDKTVDSWRTILIGGMRYGGACRATATACTDCVNTPVDVGGSSVGYSSYFAIDITQHDSPTLLWEFSHDQLGFSTTGPSIVKINTKVSDTDSNGIEDGRDDSDTAKNGKWFVAVGSGPTGPISSADQQFLGRSDQNLKLFIFDLVAGPGANNANVIVKDTSIQLAFAGSMLNVTDDADKDYQDDVLYIPFVRKCTADITLGGNTICASADNQWNTGGVGRLQTKEDLNPNNWVWSEFIEDIGPVTSSVARLTHETKGQHWLFFGAGRYYYEQANEVDDTSGQRLLFGIKEPCYSTAGFDTSCTTTQVIGNLTSVTNINDVPSDPDATTFKGWYIELDGSGSYTYDEAGTAVTRDYSAEREITDPLAVSSGLVFFTTYKPYEDVCSYGGKSFIWATRYSTGGDPGALLKGQALLQVSTGSIEQLNLSTAFSDAGGRKTSALEGVPPTAQGLSILTTPPPVKRIMHMRER